MMIAATMLLVFGMRSPSVEAAPPNIVFILADDLAWSDLGCYGHPFHETPNLDRLCQQGLRFTNAYASAPICSASRASILTGKTPARLGFEFVTKDAAVHQKLDASVPLLTPTYTLNLPLEEVTIAERLSQAGYQTAFFGKWHLNVHYQRYLGWSPTHGPKSQGFEIAEEDFGSHPYAWGKKAPAAIDEVGKFADDSMVDRVTKFIKQKHTRPYFVMASHFYVHTPVKTPYRWLTEKYDEKIPADSPARQRRLRYAAFVETLDHLVGQIVTAVDESDQADNTLILFTSDNGGHPEYTANGPMRGSKWNLYEGGTRVPLIVRWPGQVAAGTTSDVPIVGYDLHPSFADLAGVKTTGLDGTNVLSQLKQPSSLAERPLYWHFPYYHPETGFAKAPDRIGVDDFVTSRTRPQSSIRRGRYKLIHFYEDNHDELYDLTQDVSEQTDLFAEQPQIAAELSAALQDYLTEVDARLPQDNSTHTTD
ncbi:DUF4976 domain-containing protein [Blastopirellula marina]|uniref:Arylsulfatase n=2 Tax=Blastopirellula marina TaxID=124 RepID=A0A2S8G9S2_9BACT|nr:arylsulfatase [Blastopirellula marina]PTL46088.1 DUF4976 domain-containing protein [Blastopirellula marina]